MKRTVFIVGAAASLEFDRSNTMPVGTALTIQIENLLRSEIGKTDPDRFGPIKRALVEEGEVPAACIAAMNRILHGLHACDTIDQFIHDFKDVAEVSHVAKLCIASVLLEAERKCVLGGIGVGNRGAALRMLRDTWLGLICRFANHDVSRGDTAAVLSNISFVTFNYDRCIEEYFLHWIASTASVDTDRARALAAAIPIFHVYGSLGDLQNHQPSRIGVGLGTAVGSMIGRVYSQFSSPLLWRWLFENEVTFGSKTMGAAVRAAESIDTFSDLQSLDSPELGALIEEAEQIIFLGNAYHRQNLDLLFPGGPRKDVDYFGTVFGLRPADQKRVSKYFASGRSNVFRPLKSAEFLDEFRDEIFN
jgi:hypothetical protein